MPDPKTDALDELTAVAPSGGLIFHYTSQQGLLGIIKDKALWLSSIRHLSDAKEFGYAVELVQSLITDCKRNAAPGMAIMAKFSKGLMQLMKFKIWSCLSGRSPKPRTY
jgi:hypothetical protein